MSDSNGKPRPMVEVVKEVRKGLSLDDPGLLEALGEELPHLRKFLVGGETEDETWPSGFLTLRRDADHLTAKLSWPQYSIECRLSERDWEFLFREIDKGLRERSLPWIEDYQSRKKSDRKIRDGVDSAS